jgi:hypothetical protein
MNCCKYWTELTIDGKGLCEFCQAKKNICYCAGTKSQCTFPDNYKEE